MDGRQRYALFTEASSKDSINYRFSETESFSELMVNTRGEEV
jgi:hypothetical protein